MSDLLGNSFDLLTYYQTDAAKAASQSTDAVSSWRDKDTPSNELSFTDMLQLMVVQFQNQTIDNQADTSDMMNQLVQMSVVQAMTGLTTKMEEVSQASIMGYAASLVDQMVTVGETDKNGDLQEIYGKVTGTGTYNGQTIIFLDNKNSYYLSSIMAVGQLPPKDSAEDKDPDDPAEEVTPTQPGESTDETDNSGETGGTDAPVNNSGTDQEPMQI